MIREQWDGIEWQSHCRALLAQRYGPSIQFVPDRDRGDGGLEAFHVRDGTAYQCYAAQEAHNSAELTKAQNRKITRDVRKLIDDPKKTQDLIGLGRCIKTWVLLTPYIDSKDVVIHSQKKAVETRGLNPLPRWCDPDFVITVHTDELFSAERAALLGHVPSNLDIEVSGPSPAELEAAGARITDGLDKKLRVEPAFNSDPNALSSYRDEIVLDWVRGEEQKLVLENQYSSTYAEITRRARAKFRQINRATYGSSARGAAAVEQLTLDLANSLQSGVPTMSDVLCQDLARYFVASWLIQCPLRLVTAA